MPSSHQVRPGHIGLLILLALTLAVGGCASTPAPADGSGGESGGDPATNPYWVLSESDGTIPLPERARGTSVTVSADGTQIDFLGSTPEGWWVRVSQPTAFGDDIYSSDDSLTVTISRPTSSCTVTPENATAAHGAQLQLVFLEGAPAGTLTFTTIHTICPEFDDPDDPIDVERLWSLSFAEPAE